MILEKKSKAASVTRMKGARKQEVTTLGFEFPAN